MGLATAADTQNVLVRLDVPLHTQPDADADKSKSLPKTDFEKDLYAVGFAELVEKDQDWSLVRASVHGRACTRPLATNAPPGLLLYVRTKFLVPVVHTAFTFEDGPAKVEVFPGVPVRENVDATMTVAAKGLTVTGNFPTDKIGPKFVPTPSPDSNFQPTHGATGVYGTEALKFEIDGAPLSPADGDDTWAIERRCVRGVGPRIEGAAPEEGAGTPDSRGGSGRRVKDSVRVAEGTEMRWPDGIYAGTVTRGFRLPPDTDAEAKEGLVCGKVPPGVTVCVPDPQNPTAAPPLRYIADKLKAEDRKDPKPPKGEKGEEQKCRVQVDVSKTGETQSVTVRDCPEAFQEVTKEAVETWTWKPYEHQGAKVPSRHWLWVKFD